MCYNYMQVQKAQNKEVIGIMSNAFDLTVKALREKGLNSDEILEELSQLFRELANSEIDEAEKEDTKVRNLLNKLGIPGSIKGYGYWRVAIPLYKKNPNMAIVKGVYTQVAEMYSTTPSRVERGLRHAVKCVFNRCPEKIITEVFGEAYTYKKDSLTNSEFLAILAEKI